MRGRWRTIPRSSCWARTSESTAASSARPRDCRSKFGKERVQDTPLAEGMIAGMSIGMATQGLRPSPKSSSWDSSIRLWTRSPITWPGCATARADASLCPLVMRMPHGGGIHAPEHHSESLEALLAHHPGLRVVCPSSPARAYGLLLAAIRDPDPVMFLEPVRLYRLVSQDIADDGQALPLDVCYRLREGHDATIVTWGAMTFETLRAAEQLQKDGVSLRSARPCDAFADRSRHHFGVGSEDRPADHRARGAAQLWRRRGDRRDGRRARAL